MKSEPVDTTDVFVGIHMLSGSAGAQYKEHPVPSVSATLEESSTAWKLATSLLVLMALRVRLGLNASSELTIDMLLCFTMQAS